MRTKRRWFRFTLGSLSLGFAILTAPTAARAEADTFGIGDGHRGAYLGAAVDEVVNAYAPLGVDAANGTTQLTIGTVVGDPAGFVVGDLVMLLRATGVSSALAPSASQAPVDLTVADAGATGLFEFGRVTAVTATTLTLSKPLSRAFAKDLTQVIKVPEYTTVDVPAGTSIAAFPWQTAGTGFVGGVIALLANGAVSVEGTVNADQRGFRGGPGVQRVANLTINCQNDDGTVEQGYAPKGEGVIATEFGAGKGGRGNRSIAAGGGNCVENGGGGGGNKGIGGKGGDSVLGLPGAAPKGALGGAALDYSLLSRMSLGGGGGAGEQKNGLGSGGGRGGGGVFIRARSLAGGGRITANGEAAANPQVVGIESDGAGGGGAGGSIAIRLVGDARCGSLDAKGGRGGDSAQIGLSFFGPGGGGAGGRVLLQAKSTAACPVDVTPGAKGTANDVDRNAGAGAAGQAEPIPAPGGNYCFANPTADPQCANPSPVCDPTSGFCNACSGPFGGGTPRACAVAVQPVCAADGACNPCNGDFDTGSTSACQLANSPYCNTTGPTAGACGKCATNADCADAVHAGPACNPTLGACGKACTDDSQCKGTEWCAQSVCVPKTPNAEHVPNVPPIDGECTAEKGKRVCLSAVCEIEDDLCGLKDGSPCAGDSQCRNAKCKGGVCGDCIDDTGCGTGRVCDKDQKQCVPGCREVGGKSNCVAPKECSKKDGTIGQCVDPNGADGGTDGGNAADPTSGLIEGGGCACRTSLPGSGSPLALAGAAIAAVLVARRRRARRDQEQG